MSNRQGNSARAKRVIKSLQNFGGVREKYLLDFFYNTSQVYLVKFFPSKKFPIYGIEII
jgi:hypothetical protein